MRNEIYLVGEVGWEITLDAVVKAVDKSDKSKALDIHIHSAGGSVYDGLAIYNYLKTLDQEVNTISAGLVASIASVIFLAGNKETRKMNETDSFLIHLPTNMGWGDAEELEKTAEELRDIEDKISNIYANETDITADEALEQMKEDKMIGPEWLKENGFVAEIVKFKAVAKYRKTKTKNKMEKTLSKKDKSWFEKIFNKYLGPKNKIVQDANGVELDFTELEDDATPAVGDKAMVDGSNASGNYTMSNGDVFTFVDGELAEIVEDESDDDDEKATLEEVQAENETLTDDLAETKDDLAKSEKANAKMLKDINKIKGRVKSSFNWDGKNPKNIGIDKPKTRTWVKKS